MAGVRVEFRRQVTSGHSRIGRPPSSDCLGRRGETGREGAGRTAIADGRGTSWIQFVTGWKVVRHLGEPAAEFVVGAEGISTAHPAGLASINSGSCNSPPKLGRQRLAFLKKLISKISTTSEFF